MVLIRFLLILLSLILGGFNNLVNAQSSFTAGKPMTKAGIVNKVTITLTDKDGNKEAFSVDIDSAIQNTAEKKAEAIQAAATEEGIQARINPLTPAKVTFPFAATIAAEDNTNENHTLASRGKIEGDPGQPLLVGIIGFHGGVSSSSSFGAESVFEASLGLEGGIVFASSRVLFSDLSSPTIEGLLTDTYTELFNDLPKSLRQSLLLDLDGEFISFAFPPQSPTPAFVNSFTTSPTTIATLSIAQAVPAPATFVMMLAGLGLMGFAIPRRPRKSLGFMDDGDAHGPVSEDQSRCRE
jgi:hypothetical protein